LNKYSKTNIPIISIVTINYNNAHGLSRTLKSFQSQKDYGLIEHIIVDGNSVDGSGDIINDYCLKSKNSYSLIEGDKGIYNAMNKGLQLCNGTFVAYLNSGDIFADCDVLGYLIKAIKLNRHSSFFYGNLIMIDEGGKIKRVWLSKPFSRVKLLLGWMPPHPLCTINRELLLKSGGFDENMNISGDYDMMLRILLKDNPIPHWIPKILVKMELGGASNGSFEQIFKGNIEVLKAWKKTSYLIKPYWILFSKPLMKIFQIFRSKI
jgi:glycosyltransferase